MARHGSSVCATALGGDHAALQEALLAPGALDVPSSQYEAPKLSLIDFSAESCKACQRLKLEMHQLAREVPEVNFLEATCVSALIVMLARS